MFSGLRAVLSDRALTYNVNTCSLHAFLPSVCNTLQRQVGAVPFLSVPSPRNSKTDITIKLG